MILLNDTDEDMMRTMLCIGIEWFITHYEIVIIEHDVYIYKDYSNFLGEEGFFTFTKELN